LFLYHEGREIAPNPKAGQPGRKGFSPEKIEEVAQIEGVTPIDEVLRRKILYFSDGVEIRRAVSSMVFSKERPLMNRKPTDFIPERMLSGDRVRPFQNWSFAAPCHLII